MKELEQGRQVELVANAFVENKDKLVTTEDWLRSLSYCKTDDEFMKVGAPICDAIVLPKCPLLFTKEPFNEMKKFLIEEGLHVKLVYQGVRKDTVFVQLSESRNAFTLELVNKLKSIVKKLVEKTREALSKQKRKVSARKLKEELDRLYVY